MAGVGISHETDSGAQLNILYFGTDGLDNSNPLAAESRRKIIA
jgi:hypothetical protein